MRVFVAKWGASRLPKEAAASLGISGGAMVDDGAITLRRRRYDIKELVASIGDVPPPPPLLLDDSLHGSEVW